MLSPKPLLKEASFLNGGGRERMQPNRMEETHSRAFPELSVNISAVW